MQVCVRWRAAHDEHVVRLRWQRRDPAQEWRQWLEECGCATADVGVGSTSAHFFVDLPPQLLVAESGMNAGRAS